MYNRTSVFIKGIWRAYHWGLKEDPITKDHKGDPITKDHKDDPIAEESQEF